MSRLLFLSDRFPPDIGGVARSAGRLAGNLTHLGMQVDGVVWSRSLPAGEVRQEMYQGMHCYRIGRYRHWDMTLLHSLNVLEWLHQTHPYQGVWGHYLFPAGFVAVWFGKLHNVTSLVSVRGNDLEREMFPPGDFARLQWTLTEANWITTVSQDMALKVKHLVPGRSPDTLHVLPNGVDTTVFSPESLNSNSRKTLQENLGIQPEEKILGFSGELRQKKGQDFLLQALRTVREHLPACLLIIGEVRSDQEVTLLRYNSDHPDDAQRVIVTGHLAEPAIVAQHLCLCEVYLQPSLWEGMPNALLEAMAVGVGCIASDAGGIPEVLVHGETGFLLPRWNLHQLGAAVLEWMGLPEAHKQQIRQQARHHVVEHHSLEQEQKSLQQLLALVMTDTDLASCEGM